MNILTLVTNAVVERNNNLKFNTYEGTPIPLEKLLSYNCKCEGMSPIIRSKREISLIFRAECYQYVNTGLDITEMIDKILGINDKDSDDPFVVKAVNYDDYS